jgi:Cu2+-exporting ATPase
MLVSGGLLLTLGVMVNPSLGAGLMILQSSLILLNAYRFKQERLPEITFKEVGLASGYEPSSQHTSSRTVVLEPTRIKNSQLRFFGQPTRSSEPADSPKPLSCLLS